LALPLVIYIIELVVVVGFALVAIFARAIDSRGFLASVAVGYSIILGGGVAWFAIVAAFFTLGVAFTWYEYGYKKKVGGAQEKGGARNWPNILANGGLASVFAMANRVTPGPLLPVLFLGSIATSAADTVATELGLLSKSTPKLIIKPTKSVPPGTSGGVSPLGFVGAVFASFVIGLMALLLGVVSSAPLVLAVCAVGGVTGAVVDSLIGATFQRKGYCVICQRPTEALSHCGEKSTRTGGVPFIENNMVNLISTLAGAIVAAAVAVV